MHLKCIVTTLAAATILTAQPCAAAQSTGADSPPSVAVINQRLLDTTQDSSLDDAAKAGIRGLYQQALSELEAAARWRVAALDFARRTTDAPAVLAQLEAAVTAPPAAAPSISTKVMLWTTFGF